MAALIYIHGFLSSPHSSKAQQTQAWLAQHHPEITYHCPALTPYPEQTRAELEQLVESLLPAPIYVMGSSLGGFWASWLAEKYNLRAVLINTAIHPQELMPKYVGIELKSYHSTETFLLQQKHLDEFKALDVLPVRIKNYWLLSQTGDEVLDYRQAAEYYAGAKQTLEAGGDHSFQNFEKHLEHIFTFLTKNIN
jgi:uncharacterized protein